jgi:uncharacterized protein YjbI with pentapeptide repeats
MRSFVRVVAFGAAVALFAGLFATVGANAAFADTVVDGCTIVADPTPTHFTSCAGANLARADLSGLNLAYADLRFANLSQANLSGATLAACQFQLAEPHISCQGARLDSTFLVGANLHGAVTSICVSIDLGDGIGTVPFCGGVAMAHANLHNADVSGDDLSFALLTAANVSRANLHGTRFGECASASKAELMACSGTDLSGAKLAHTDLSADVLRGANLQGANLVGANLSGADLSLLLPDFGVLPTLLDGADLRGANLRGANVTGASVSGANFSHAVMQGAIFTDANLKGVRFVHAHLAGATLTGADLTTANMTDARLIGAHLAGAILTDVVWLRTVCPDGTNSNFDGHTCVGHL